MVEANEAWPHKATQYQLVSPVGQGAFGLVWKA